MKHILPILITIALFTALVLCNFYYIPAYIPEAVSLLFALVLLLLNIRLIAKGRTKAPKIIMTTVSILAVCCGFAATYLSPYWNSIVYLQSPAQKVAYSEILTSEQALQDIATARKYLTKVHPAALDGLPQNAAEMFDEIEQTVRAQESVTVSELQRALASAVSCFQDGHTNVYSNFPEYRYLKCIYAHNEAGDRMAAVNGIPLRELYEQNKAYFSYDEEAEDYGYIAFRNIFTRPDGLAFLNIPIENGVVYTYEHPDGTTEDVVAYDEDFLVYAEYAAYNQIPDSTEETSFVSYEIDAAHDLAVLTLNNCICNEEYRNVLHEMFTAVKEQGITRVAVDLRENGGGSSAVGTEFIRYLPVDRYWGWAAAHRMGCLNLKIKAMQVTNKKHSDLTFDGEVYVLTSGITYSSAMDFAMYIKDNKLGQTVGEAPLNDPRGYGMVTQFRMPHSGLNLQISTAKWSRIDESDPTRFIEPDIPCDAEEALEMLRR